MNQEKLSHIAKNPSEISAEDARELEELTRNFPYFSLPYALLTRYYAVNHDYRYEDTLHKTALRVNDRAWLYDFVHAADPASVSPSQSSGAVQNDIIDSLPGTEVVAEEKVLEEIPVLPGIAESAETPLETSKTTEVIPEVEELVMDEAETPLPKEILAPVEILEEKEPEPSADSVLEIADSEVEPAIEEEAGLEEPVEVNPLSESGRYFEPDHQAMKSDLAEVSEDAVFEEIELFDSKSEPAPELMGEDENTLELMAELDLSGPMVFPDTGIEEPAETTEPSPEIVSPPAVRLPLAGSVYNIEDYYPAENESQSGPPSDFFSWLTNPEYSGEEKEPVKPPVEDKKHELIDKFIHNPIGISRPKADFFNATDVAKKSEVFPDDIVTETLAGVYLKQENYSGAIRIYEKLVLKFPEKSAYFAALIEKVKKEHL